MTDAKRKKSVIALLIVILIVFLGVLFYFYVLPKLAVRYMRSDQAPEFLQEVNTKIENNSALVRKTLSSYGISNEQAVKIVKSMDFDDIKYIQTELSREGYNNKGECADIILSRIDDEEIDKEKLKAGIVENISLSELQWGMDEFANLDPGVVKAALPVLKEMFSQSLLKN